MMDTPRYKRFRVTRLTLASAVYLTQWAAYHAPDPQTVDAWLEYLLQAYVQATKAGEVTYIGRGDLFGAKTDWCCFTEITRQAHNGWVEIVPTAEILMEGLEYE